jgi:hypothetical protein
MLSEKNEKKDEKKAEWKPNPDLTMEIKKSADWKPNDKLTMTLKESKNGEDKK